jgi:uncharacterized protein
MHARKKALLIGNYKDAPYHPLDKVENEIMDILKDMLDVECTEDQGLLRSAILSDFDVCISYADSWEKKLEREIISGILSFVSGGKGLLVLHSGISFQKNYEFAQLIGGRFTGHPEARELEFRTTSNRHSIMRGVEGFSAFDEPYIFEMDNFSEKTVLFEYELDGKKFPAGWAIDYGMGKAVYLMPGHTAGSFMIPEYRMIISNGAKWLLERG